MPGPWDVFLDIQDPSCLKHVGSGLISSLRTEPLLPPCKAESPTLSPPDTFGAPWLLPPAPSALPGPKQGQRQCLTGTVSLLSPQDLSLSLEDCPSSSLVSHPSLLRDVCLGFFSFAGFNQSPLNAEAGYFCCQKSAASPPAAFLEFAHRTPQEGQTGMAKPLGSQERQRHLSYCLFPTPPHPNPCMHTGPHTCIPTSMHTFSTVCFRKATSQPVLPRSPSLDSRWSGGFAGQSFPE